ncbi:LysR family transcriptional regulator [Dongia sp.]|uniref:LysR family transcriptional regulator n=1 Tax=Dongia sp. TaxID=1977262 RepID=UPI0035AF858C
MIPFTFRQIDYFVATAEHGNVSAAARARRVAQPAMSMAIAQLEALLGEKLFHRRAGHGLTLTPAGRQLLAQARELMDLAGRMAHAAPVPAGPLKGRLAIACFKDIAPYVLPRLLAGFRREHPDAVIDLFEADFTAVREALVSGRSELALTYELGIDADIRRQVLLELPPYALLPAKHPLAKKAKVSLAALAKERLILEDMAQSREYFMSLFWAQGLQPRIGQYTQSFEMQRGLVAHGAGIALSCTRPWGDRSYDGVPIACRPIAEKLAPQRVVIADIGQGRQSPLAAAFLAFAQ